MAYHADKRVVIGRPGQSEADVVNVAIHEDRGDGTAACAVGSRKGITKAFMVSADGVRDEWVPLPAGQVNCLLCADVKADAERTTRVARPQADSTARPLSERTPKSNRSLLGDLPW